MFMPVFIINSVVGGAAAMGGGWAGDGVAFHLFWGGTGIAGVGVGRQQRSSCLFGVYLVLVDE